MNGLGVKNSHHATSREKQSNTSNSMSEIWAALQREPSDFDQIELALMLRPSNGTTASAHPRGACVSASLPSQYALARV